MTKRHLFKVKNTLSSVAIIALSAAAVSAEPQPIGSPHGSILGTVDGHTFDLPVRCETWTGALDVSSHDQPISNNSSIGGVEPAVSVLGFNPGFQFVAFIGGTRYKFLSVTDTIETFPYAFTGEVKDKEHGEIEVEFTLNCPSP